MYKTIEQYCNNGNNNGLMLIDMPTGTGKTHNVLDYIFDVCNNPENEKQKYFFVTTLKKNLPVEELKDRFIKAGKATLAEEKILFLESNVDSVVKNLKDNLIKQIPGSIRNTAEYMDLYNAVVSVQKLSKETNNYFFKSFEKEIREQLRTRKEPKFRKMIEKLLKDTFTTVDDRLLAIKTDDEWKWVGQLYPAVFTRDKQIIFMSMDKMIAQNSTIVEPAYHFFASDIITGAVIFIDEFDATKDTILKNIIENGVKEKIDYIELFDSIYSTLQNHSFQRQLLISSKKRNESEFKEKSLEGIINDIKEKAKDIYNTYSLQFTHKTVDNDAEASKNFLFQDHQFHSILDARKSYIIAQTDPRDRVNKIVFSQKKPKFEKENIHFMLGKIRGFIQYFEGAVKILAINYMQLRQERRTANEDEFTYEQAVKSVLDEFKLNERYIEFLTDQILFSTKVRGSRRRDDVFDLSFYQKGFRYYSFEDSPDHDMHSKMMMYSFQNTPEQTMLKFCEKAKVVGISATATLESVVGNYDIEYIKAKLGSFFVKPSNDDYLRMRKEFDESICYYSNVNIVSKALGIDNGEKFEPECWNKLFENEEIASYVHGEVENYVYGNNKDYLLKRYFRIAQAYSEFICNDDIQSFLCVLNKHPKKNDHELDQDVLLKIFDRIAKEKDCKLEAKDCVKYLFGDEYESNKEEILSALSKGKKLFVISAYQTIGAGQNLQYVIPKGTDLVHINERDPRAEKDFDAIYLDKPTNLLVNLGENLEDNNFIKYLYQVEFLQESGELSTKDALKHVKKAFKTFTTKHTQYDNAKKLSELDSSKAYLTKIIIQAIGRICRTNMKNKNIYVFVDRDILECIDVSLLKNRLLNPEFEAVLKTIGANNSKSEDAQELIYASNLRSIRANGFINNMLQDEWTERRMDEWKFLRDFVLTHPTISLEAAKTNMISRNFYVCLPFKNNQYYYGQQQDYNDIEVSFTKKINCPNTVSSENANLDLLMQDPSLKKFFVRNNWATSFEKNECVMSPALYNNIYKGALGEEVGKHILEEQHGYILEEIKNPKLFELFDYKIKGFPIYVDFKNWHESTDFDNNEMLEKIKSKSDVCPDCKCVFIINIVAPNKYMSRSVKLENGVEVIIIPSLFNDHNGQLRLDDKSHKDLEDKKLEYSNYNKQN